MTHSLTLSSSYEFCLVRAEVTTRDMCDLEVVEGDYFFMQKGKDDLHLGQGICFIIEKRAFKKVIIFGDRKS